MDSTYTPVRALANKLLAHSYIIICVCVWKSICLLLLFSCRRFSFVRFGAFFTSSTTILAIDLGIHTVKKKLITTASDRRKFCLIIWNHLVKRWKRKAHTERWKYTVEIRIESSKWSPHDQTICGVNRIITTILIPSWIFLFSFLEYKKQNKENGLEKRRKKKQHLLTTTKQNKKTTEYIKFGINAATGKHWERFYCKVRGRKTETHWKLNKTMEKNVGKTHEHSYMVVERNKKKELNDFGVELSSENR